MPRRRRSGVPGLQQPTYQARDGSRRRAKKWTLVVKRGKRKRCFALDTEFYAEACERARKKLAELDARPQGPSRRPIAEHVGNWLAAIEARIRSKRHLKERERYLRDFVRDTNARTIHDLDGAAAALYLGSLLERGLSASTLEHCRSALRAFSRWLVDTDQLERDPFRSLPPYQVSADRRYERGAYTWPELQRLFRAAPAYREAAYRLAFSTALRRGELGRLPRSAVDLKGRRVLAKLTKNGKPRWLALSRATVACLRRYWRDFDAGIRRPGFPKRGLSAGLALPEGVPGVGRLEDDMEAAKPKVEKFRDGYPRDFHSFRVSWNTLLAQRGEKSHVRQRGMGHSKPELTEGPIYLRDVDPELRAAVDDLDRAAKPGSRRLA